VPAQNCNLSLNNFIASVVAILAAGAWLARLMYGLLRELRLPCGATPPRAGRTAEPCLRSLFLLCYNINKLILLIVNLKK